MVGDFYRLVQNEHVLFAVKFTIHGNLLLHLVDVAIDFFAENHTGRLLKVFGFQLTPLFEVFYLNMLESDCEVSIPFLESHFCSLCVAKLALAISIATKVAELADTL